jgi:uncharacterized protein
MKKYAVFFYFLVFLSTNVFGITFFKGPRLLWHVKKGNLEKVSTLIDKEANVNYLEESSNRTPLMYAAENGYASIVKTLLDSGADVKKLDIHSITALIYASFNGYEDIVKLLVTSPIEVINHIDHGSRNALSHSLNNNHFVAAKVLIENNANSEQSNSSGETPMSLALLKNKTSLIQLMLDKGYNINYQTPSAVKRYFYKYDVNTASHVLMQKTYITSCKTALMYASSVKEVSQDSLEILVEAGAALDLQDASGDTALMYACRSCQINKIKFLVSKGSNLKIENFSKRTALDVAIKHGCTEAQIYLKQGVCEEKVNPREDVLRSTGAEEGSSYKYQYEF